MAKRQNSPFKEGILCKVTLYVNGSEDNTSTYPDLNRRSICSTQPVSVGREAQCCDDVIVVKGVKALAIIQVPEHSFHVLATGGAEGAIRRDSYCVQVT